MSKLKISRLHSGGLITNYYCSSHCGHCLYKCSANREKHYISKAKATEVFKKIRSLGCYSVHIGGGEPMLNIPQLLEVAAAANEAGMGIDYVETNSSWFQTGDKAIDVLNECLRHGIRQLLVSISPFHNEYIPFYKVKGVLQACRKTGMSVFPWVMDFYSDIDAFDDQICHPLSEYQERFGPDYLRNIPQRYWTHLGGRAISTFREVFPSIPADLIFDSPPCIELSDTGHFHIDLFGNYIPGLCTGLAIDMDDLGSEPGPDKYPILTRLYTRGIGALHSYASERYGFKPKPDYLNKCDLCNDIRRFLVINCKIKSAELKPLSYYTDID